MKNFAIESGNHPTTGFSPKTVWSWWNKPGFWTLSSNNDLLIEAKEGSDLFFVPNIREIDQIAVYERPIKGDFTMSVCVRAEGKSYADGAGILIRKMEKKNEWLKICLELSQSLEWTIDTVFTNPISDEARGANVSNNAIGFQIIRDGSYFGILWSEIQTNPVWKFVRALWWKCPETVQIGLFVQAPFSKSCQGTFSDLSISQEASFIMR